MVLVSSLPEYQVIRQLNDRPFAYKLPLCAQIAGTDKSLVFICLFLKYQECAVLWIMKVMQGEEGM